MDLIEYIVFFGLLGFGVVLFITYKSDLEEQPATEYKPDILKCDSPIEKRLYIGLLQHGLLPTAQYSVKPYWIDLAFPENMLAIECDGRDYHSSPEQKAHDKKRDKFLRENGWIVLRFSGRTIYRDLPNVVNKVKIRLEERNKIK